MQNDETVEIFTKTILEIFKVYGFLTIEGDALTKEFGLSSARWKVLGAIVKTGSPLTVSQISRTMGQSRQATQRLTDIMVQQGLLKLEENPDHKTAKLVALTDLGLNIYNALDEKQFKWAKKCTEEISFQELEQTLSTLKKMSEHFLRGSL
ncbi:MarR family winged helix-turn-helix transcriptional regulator [Vibrio sp. Isolate22]|uniref:MarR family winged helix-turn-helix transcriptional regulator n=1 Tax=Vibrio sp. Isolate22 TaxID=2908532 RepID=UPI001EFD963D|nr:MarR family winged helix-turn-helix transcriptional regulator [Vibrio sp. Isolate22]MCG9695239.1 MarR family winged helix-turn-helix transcriptional regulator [Vibrio sp. Isolate22]